MNQDTKKAALEVFERYPNAKEVYITPDNQAFLGEDRARLHNKEFTTVKRSEVVETKEPAPAKKSAEELIAFIPSCETIEELEALEKDETRKTVLAAIKTRKEELNKAD